MEASNAIFKKTQKLKRYVYLRYPNSKKYFYIERVKGIEFLLHKSES